MRISTRTRYGIRLMMNLAGNYNNGYSLLKDIAKKEEISEKYLSLIVIPLKSAGFLNTVRGSRGGYSLSKEPSKIKVRNIVEVLEGDLCLLECVKNKESCSRSPGCGSRDLWIGLSNAIAGYLDNLTLEDLDNLQSKKDEKLAGNYSI